jgi:anti-sigma28 factor (negative regulator of flagellin synthesis)
VKSYDHPSSNASGAAAARQTERLTSDEELQAPVDGREARVAEIREQYQRGTYRVDAAEVSSSIVDEHLKR